MHCLRCNYDLSLIPDADVCPECGSSQRHLTQQRESLVRWANPYDKYLVLLWLLSTAIAYFVSDVLLLPPMLLMLIAVAGDFSAAPRAIFPYLRATKIIAIRFGIVLVAFYSILLVIKLVRGLPW